MLNRAQCLGIMLLSIFFVSLTCVQTTLAANKPNVVLVVLDDATASDVTNMPALQQLAREGATFTKSYTPTPICVPSRATIQTGLYRNRHQVLSNGFGPLVYNGALSRSLAVGLQTSGIDTTFVGKYLNGAPKSVPGWRSFAVHIGDADKEHLYYDYNIRLNGKFKFYGSGAKNYSTDVFRNMSLQNIQIAVNARRQFFTMLNVAAPHYPCSRRSFVLRLLPRKLGGRR
jgi:arylsulfatase A-like enzyme